MEEDLNKKLVMTKKNNKDFQNSTKCWIWDIVCIKGDVKGKYCHITGKNSGPTHNDYNINVKFNHRSPFVFFNLRNYDSHFIMKEPGKFYFKINIIPNGVEKYTSFNINNKFVFIDNFQFSSSLLNSLVKNLGKDFKHLSLEFDSNMWNLFDQKVCYHYVYNSSFDKFEEKLPSKEKVQSSLTGR